MTTQYPAMVRAAGNDLAKKARLAAIYKRTRKLVESKPGLGGVSDVYAGLDEMRAVIKQ